MQQTLFEPGGAPYRTNRLLQEGIEIVVSKISILCIIVFSLFNKWHMHEVYSLHVMQSIASGEFSNSLVQAWKEP